MTMFGLTSSAFENEGNIPDLYTCRGRNISPPLSWRNPPERTKSYALIVEDLDTPFGVVTHWLVYNIPATFSDLPQAVPPGEILENGLRQGRNGMFRFRYMGPCPPWGRHRYRFSLYALDSMIETDAVLNKRKLLREIEPHILATARLIGYYARKRSTL